MQVELLDLVDKIAFDSITDVKLFDEVKKQLEKIVSYSASRMKPKEQAQSSKAKEESQTIVKPAAITRRKKKERQTRRTSARQEQKRTRQGDELATKKPPVKKPRQNRLCSQAKKEEKQ
jgi:hypothetical protein